MFKIWRNLLRAELNGQEPAMLSSRRRVKHSRRFGAGKFSEEKSQDLESLFGGALPIIYSTHQRKNPPTLPVSVVARTPAAAVSSNKQRSTEAAARRACAVLHYSAAKLNATF